MHLHTALRQYPKYKESGALWFGTIPCHWKMVRVRAIARNIVDLTFEWKRNDICLGLEHVESWTGRFTPADGQTGFSGQMKRFRAGDILFGKLRPYLAKVTCPGQSGICVGEFLVLRLICADVSPRYLECLLRSKPSIDAIDTSTFGARMPRTDWQFIGNLQIPIPSLPDQIAIVRLLENVERQVRRYVRAKERSIGLLEEEKQAIINQAVTRGLDPNVRLKASGVEWLGDVPGHWERRRLKTVLRPIDERSTTGDQTLLSLRRDHGVVVYAEHFKRPPQSRSLVGFKLVRIGQLVVNRLQANNGLVFNSKVAGLVSPDYSVFEERIPIHMQYLSDLLRTSTYRAYFRRNATGLGTGTAGFLRLYDDAFLRTPVFLPPVTEQRSIVEHLAKANVERGAAIRRAHRQIELLQEYRTRLIADVVTGKLDVREAAAGLGDEEEGVRGEK